MKFLAFTLSIFSIFLISCGASRESQLNAPQLDETLLTPRVLSVLAVADPAFSEVPAWCDRAKSRIQGVNSYLTEQNIKLELQACETLSEISAFNSSALLGDLESAYNKDNHADLPDLIVLFSSVPQSLRTTNEEMVAAHYASPYIVVFSHALRLNINDGESLHLAETKALLRGTALALGALFCSKDDVLQQILLYEEQTMLRANHDLHLQDGLTFGLSSKGNEDAMSALNNYPKTCNVKVKERFKALSVAHDERKNYEIFLEQASIAADEGLNALASGNPSKALNLCSKYADRLPESKAARCAGLAADAIGETVKAVVYLRAYSSIHQTDAEVIRALARQLGRGGDDAAALALLRRFLDYDPNDRLARLNLGIAALRVGLQAEAREAFEYLLNQDPNDKEAAELLRWVN